MKKTISKIIIGDSKCLSDVNRSSIGLVVTSPPYPMIAMWDEIFSNQDNRISQALKADNGTLSFGLPDDESMDSTCQRNSQSRNRGLPHFDYRAR